MKTFPLTNPVVPYYGNTLDNELIAANTKVLEEELPTHQNFQFEKPIITEDSVMFSTTTEERIHVCYEIGNRVESDEIHDIILDDDEGIHWDDSFSL